MMFPKPLSKTPNLSPVFMQLRTIKVTLQFSHFIAILELLYIGLIIIYWAQLNAYALRALCIYMRLYETDIFIEMKFHYRSNKYQITY